MKTPDSTTSGPRITLRVEDENVLLRLDPAAAPRTVDAVLRCLPARADLHCAKIAGDEVIFFLPVLLPLEQAVEAESVTPGSLVYWPERQMFGLFFGMGQKERASLTVAGQVVGNLAGLRRLGERVQEEHGRRITWARLEPAAGEAGHPDPLPADAADDHGPAADDYGPAVVQARRARLRMWDGVPDEVAALARRRGVMVPAGPLLYGESETRELHENLWVIREAVREAPYLGAGEGGWRTPAAAAVAPLLRHAADRLGGFSGLDEAARFLARAAGWLDEPTAEVLPLLDELILYAGRLNAWLDLFVPWKRFNDVLLDEHRSY